jgi:hypothetical protein
MVNYPNGCKNRKMKRFNSLKLFEEQSDEVHSNRLSQKNTKTHTHTCIQTYKTMKVQYITL